LSRYERVASIESVRNATAGNKTYAKTLKSSYIDTSLAFFKKLFITTILTAIILMTGLVFTAFYLASAPANTPMYYTYHAISYGIRYYTGKTLSIKPQLVFTGNIKSAAWKDNVLWIKIAYNNDDGIPTYAWFSLANSDVIADKANAVISYFRNNRGPYAVEVYFDNQMKQVLLYGDDQIINLKLIEMGFALPSKNPITRKIDKIFSDFYFQESGFFTSKNKLPEVVKGAKQ